jgi:hypothetical protein
MTVREDVLKLVWSKNTKKASICELKLSPNNRSQEEAHAKDGLWKTSVSQDCFTPNAQQNQ